MAASAGEPPPFFLREGVLMLGAFVVALVLVAIAELGDKTQMLTLVLSARYGARPVLAGVAAAVVALQALAVVAGGLVGALIPPGVLAWGTGLLFIGFGVWTLMGRSDDEDVDAEADRASGGRPLLATAAAFFLAELGDKTQIMTMTIAASPVAAAGSLRWLVPYGGGETGPWILAAVWLGSTTGMLLVNGVAALVGTALGSKLSPALVARVSGAVFLAFGVWTIASQVLGG